MTFNIEIQAAFMFYHKWIPCMIMKTQVFPCLTQKRPMPTFLQSLGWSSAAYASWSCHWKTPHGSENRCLSFKRSAVVTGCFQMKLVVLTKTASFLYSRGPTLQRDGCFLYVPLQPPCSAGFLQPLMLSQQRVSASCTSLWLHLLDVSESVPSLHSFGTTRSSIW